MSLATIYTRAQIGINSPVICVEVHLAKGLPYFSIVGLPETTVKESKDRVKSAIINSSLEFPCRKIIVNLAPAGIPKEGGRYDLAIALGILAASEQIEAKKIEILEDYEFAGELALSGKLRPISNIIPFAIASQKEQKTLIVPTENFTDLYDFIDYKIFDEQKILGAKSLTEVYQYIDKQKTLPTIHCSLLNKNSKDETKICINNKNQPNLIDIKGQTHAKRALEIAASGGHNLLMVGSPGTGKTMLANCLSTILPELSTEEFLEIIPIYSLSNLNVGFNKNNSFKRSFRNPHHSLSTVAMIGGGSSFKPGEISLAHKGVLFLDEFPEFNKQIIESLREPLESGEITISRARYKITLPAKFQLVIAMNPCPCGNLYNSECSDHDDQFEPCSCSLSKINNYLSKISNALLDRIEISITMMPFNPKLLIYSNYSDKSDIYSDIHNIKQRIREARNVQLKRSKALNCELSNQEILRVCNLSKNNKLFLAKAFKKLKSNPRGFYKVLKVARTIADLEQKKTVSNLHIKEALLFRIKDLKKGLTTL